MKSIISAASRSRGFQRAFIYILLGSIIISLVTACDTTGAVGNKPVTAGSTPTATSHTARYPAVMPTATMAAPSASNEPGVFSDLDLGFSFYYPQEWRVKHTGQPNELIWLQSTGNPIITTVYHAELSSSESLQSVAEQFWSGYSQGVTVTKQLRSEAIKLDDGRDAWNDAYMVDGESFSNIEFIQVSVERAGHYFFMVVVGSPGTLANPSDDINAMIESMRLEAPSQYGFSRDQTLVMEGGESNNARDYDPATGYAGGLVFSGLVMFDQHLDVVPDLAESWDINADGTRYTFHLRPNARFHNGRPVTAQDVIYSWERAASPAIGSTIVLTYLGDIVGVREMHSGKANHISGLKALNDHTLQVTIDEPKPYFLMKLTYGVGSILDKANVESGTSWYRTPNGTGPYKLIRWDDKAILYERFEDFYLSPPSIKYVVEKLFAGTSLQLYESGDIDLTSVSSYNIDRLRAPDEPLHKDLVENVEMCTEYTIMDVQQPPFDDPKVRQAFALAIDRQQYVATVLKGIGIPAHGLYPPALAGFNPELKGQEYNPDLARQLLASSKYGGPDKLPTITYTTSGFGSSVYKPISALAAMWEQNLGVKINIENLEPDRSKDEIDAGHHGQLLAYGWCADYPDPENFADTLFHTGSDNNLGHYSNPALDALLEKARVERDTTLRLGMYKQAEQIIVDDSPAIFLNYSMSYRLIKPYVKGYVHVPLSTVPFFRWLSIDPSQMR